MTLFTLKKYEKPSQMIESQMNPKTLNQLTPVQTVRE
jgi:hypothetical protein